MDTAVSIAMADLPGAGLEAVRAAALTVARDFFSRTGTWRMTVTEDLDFADPVYQLTCPPGSTLANIPFAQVDGWPLPAVAKDFLHSRNMDGRRCFHWTASPDGAEVRFEGLGEGGTGKMLLEAALYPTRIDAVPPQLDAQHGPVVALGILSLMMNQPKRPYTNPVLARQHGMAYRSQRYMAARTAATGNLHDPAYETRLPSPLRWYP
jgi:hypothetical protein